MLLRGDIFCAKNFLQDTILGGSLWFTSALAVAELLLFTMVALMRNKSLWHFGGVSLLLVIGALMMKYSNITIWGNDNIPWFYKAGMIAVFYLVFGGVYELHEEKFSKLMQPGILVLFILGYSYISLFSKIEVQTAINVAQLNILGLVMSVGGIILLIELCKKLPSIGLFQWVGRNTLVMYFLSGGIPNILSVFFVKLGMHLSFMPYLVISMISFMLGVVGSYIIGKYFPFVLDLRTIKKKNLQL